MSTNMPMAKAPRRRFWRRMLYGSALGFVISLIFLWLPFVSTFTGPIGPMVGGYVVGSRFRVQVAEGLLIGLGMGLMAVLPDSIGLLLAAFDLMAPPAVSPRVVWMLNLMRMFYVAALGAAGAVIAGYLLRKEQQEQQEQAPSG